MGRVKGKGKKQNGVAAQNDAKNTEDEENISGSKRRGRPQKPWKDEAEDEEINKIENGDGNSNSSMAGRSSNGQISAVNGTKRKRPSQVKEKSDTVKEENGVEAKSVAGDFVKSVGFRHNGSRRKNKPRRAAEVGVECK